MKFWKIIPLGVLAGAVGAQASLIPIANPSFETVTIDAGTSGCITGGNITAGDYLDNVTNFGQGNGCVTAQPLPGWTLTGGDGGAAAIGFAPYFPGGFPDGQNVAFAQGNLVISQVLGDVLQAGEYTFGVYVGGRQDNYTLTGYTTNLLAGSTVIGTNTQALPDPGYFIYDTFVVDIGAGDPNLGQQLSIALSTTGGQANFDLVTLDFQPSGTPAPEPSTWVLAGAALWALSIWRRG